MANGNSSGFDVNAARQAGYSDDEILQHLQQSRNFDVQGALQSGYNKADVINYLASTTAAGGSTGPQATEKANLFIPGVGYTQMDVPAGTAKDYEAGYTHGLRQGAGLAAASGALAAIPIAGSVAGTAAGGGALGLGANALTQGVGSAALAKASGASTPAAVTAGVLGAAMPVAGAALNALPNAAKAGKALEALDQQIGDETVDISKVGDVALEAQDWWSHGGQRIKQISDFLREATAPGADELTYSDARQFLSNAGRRLSATEAQNLPPQGRKYLAQFAKALDDAIQSTAQDAGVLDEYNAAIKEYRQGMNLNDAWQWGKSMAKGMAEKAIQNAPWIGGAYAIAKKYAP